MWDLIQDCVPADSSHQVNADWMANQHVSKDIAPLRVLDVGCGDGGSHELFKVINSNTHWTGVDIEMSPEVSKRSRSDLNFLTFDGVNIPLSNSSIDVVFSRQVLEHVRSPEMLLRDISRVLKGDGIFVGSTSQTEPYHSFQYWNFTVFGFRTICADAGLKLIEVRPGIDGKTLVERSYLGRPKSYSRFFHEASPLNLEIDAWGLSTKRSHKQINVRKLAVCGQFSFLCQKA